MLWLVLGTHHLLQLHSRSLQCWCPGKSPLRTRPMHVMQIHFLLFSIYWSIVKLFSFGPLQLCQWIHLREHLPPYSLAFSFSGWMQKPNLVHIPSSSSPVPTSSSSKASSHSASRLHKRTRHFSLLSQHRSGVKNKINALLCKHKLNEWPPTRLLQKGENSFYLLLAIVSDLP